MSFPWFVNIRSKITEHVHIAPLSLFRVLFGGMMFCSILRFWLKGWIEELYVKPVFFFKYYGFEWVEVPGQTGLYILFGIIALSALFLMVGFFYRISAVVFFLSFTYSELLDKTNYLNHYYFISIVAFLLIFLPAGKFFSLDVFFRLTKKISHIPGGFIFIIQLQLAFVYFFAGVAKLNPDWLFEAQPLRLWLHPHTDLPLIGPLMDKVWIAYTFSWFGAIYDLVIPFLLFSSRWRNIAYFFVIAFHVTTSALFPIGMFPYIMIVSTLIFFPAAFHLRIIDKFNRLFSLFKFRKIDNVEYFYSGKPVIMKGLVILFAVHFIIQIALPFRYLAYPGDLFWTEQGFRFSWRVMLMEKAGKAYFYVTDKETQRSGEIMMESFLTPNQEKMMATQPDMILQYARFLKKKYQETGMKEPKISADIYVTLNGRGSRPYINRDVDLAELQDTFSNKWWILPSEGK